jgi:hypothetical protein
MPRFKVSDFFVYCMPPTSGGNVTPPYSHGVVDPSASVERVPPVVNEEEAGSVSHATRFPDPLARPVVPLQHVSHIVSFSHKYEKHMTNANWTLSNHEVDKVLIVYVYS